MHPQYYFDKVRKKQKISYVVWRTANIELTETTPLDRNFSQFIWGKFF